jgi:hypothetical protein
MPPLRSGCSAAARPLPQSRAWDSPGLFDIVVADCHRRYRRRRGFTGLLIGYRALLFFTTYYTL